MTHRAIDRRIEAEVARADRMDRPLTLAILDIDRFRALNQRHGYPVGDGVLRSLALLLRRRLRRSDIIGRFGGDRIAILLPETAPELAEELFDRIRIAFAGMTLPALWRSVFQGRTQGTAPRSISSMMARVTLS